MLCVLTLLRWHTGFGIYAVKNIDIGELVDVRGQHCVIPVNRREEMADSRRHRWSVGSDDLKRHSPWFYLGGPLSLLNAACRRHAACDYSFSLSEYYAKCTRSIGPGEELTCCYNGGGDGAALTNSGKVVICCHLDCEEFVMHL